MRNAIFVLYILFLPTIDLVVGQKITIDRNKPDRKEWFTDMGFGMFIHWSVDVQL